jgi:hypothetical protein
MAAILFFVASCSKVRKVGTFLLLHDINMHVEPLLVTIIVTGVGCLIILQGETLILE